jgi:hypothetical protein
MAPAIMFTGRGHEVESCPVIAVERGTAMGGRERTR